MPKIHRMVEQGTLEWFNLRLGKVTASELGQIVTPSFELRTGKMPFTYLCGKVYELRNRRAMPGFISYATEQGSMREDDAIPWYRLHTGKQVARVGFVEADDPRFGASPDGLIGEEGGVEIKCPGPEAHVSYVLNEKVPDDYLPQVHGSLYATGRAWWDFVSYRPDFDKLVVRVHRDEEIIVKIEAALTAFYVRLDAAMRKISKNSY